MSPTVKVRARRSLAVALIVAAVVSVSLARVSPIAASSDGSRTVQLTHMAGSAGSTGPEAPARFAGEAPKSPGTLIQAQAVGAPGLTGTTYRVEYWSRSVPANKPVRISGVVIVPSGTPPTGGWPVITWDHPTDGMTGNCAPSLDPATDVPYADELLAQGWAIAATDYESENAYAPTSSKLLPYLVGAAAARDAIDIVRAARQIPAAATGTVYQTWGWSEGGQTALWVNQIAGSYAPELALKGAVATAPGAELPSLFASFESSTEWWPLVLMAAAGLNADYGNAVAPLTTLLTTDGKKLIASALKREPQCITGIITDLTSHDTFASTFQSSNFPISWQGLLAENDPANFTTAGSAPVLIVQGTADTLVQPPITAALADQLCAVTPPQPLERWLYTGLDHFTSIGTQLGPPNASGNGDSAFGSSATIGDVVAWMRDRFAGGGWPDPYAPTAAATTLVTETNAC